MALIRDDDDWDAFAEAQTPPTERVTHEDRTRLISDWRKAFADTGLYEKQSASRFRWLDVVIAFIAGTAIGGALVGWLMW